MLLWSCKKDKDDHVYSVEFYNVTADATNNSATISANYSYINSLDIVLVYSQNTDMSGSINVNTIDHNKTITCILDNLNADTQYYYYFIYSNGMSSDKTSTYSFVTLSDPVSNIHISTKGVSEITMFSAISGGIITGDTISIIRRGVCYNTNPNPSIDNITTSDGNGMGEYVSVLTNLEVNTKYYIKAYATTEDSVYYGNELSFTTNQIIYPTIITKPVSDITATTATCGGNITNEGPYSIVVRGVCWSTHDNPTTSDALTSDGDGIGEFVSYMTGLQPETNYYVRAYAIMSNDEILYGNPKTFTTNQIPVPVITTNEVTQITQTSAICGGNIISDGGYQIFARGVCWSTHENPTTSDALTSDGNDIGEFISYLTDLQPNTQYYVRAYAINSNDVYYGDQQSFTTHIFNTECFSISNDRKIIFSPGNLQYNSHLNIWRFAENQYDYCGAANENIGPNYNDWIDLFGYGTSGYNGCEPWLIDDNYSLYASNTTNISGTMYDWGLYININNTQGEWRTLTSEEWLYLINQRENAAELRAKAVVNRVKGFVLLPDNWVKPENINFVADATDWSTNVYNLSQWDELNDSNAVFLPAAGNRNMTTVYDTNNIGGYWTSSSGILTSALYVIFTESTYNTTSSVRYFGRSVRLAKDL